MSLACFCGLSLGHLWLLPHVWPQPEEGLGPVPWLLPPTQLCPAPQPPSPAAWPAIPQGHQQDSQATIGFPKAGPGGLGAAPTQLGAACSRADARS